MSSEDWPEVRLGDLVDERGISYGIVQPGTECDGGVPIVRVSNLRDGRIQTDVVKRVAPEIEAKYGRTRLRGGEVLVSLVGSLGETAVVPASLSGWNVARAVAVVPVRDDVGADWVAYALRSSELQRRMQSRATTTVQATLNLQDVRELPIPLPDKSERDRATSALRALDEKIGLNRRMNCTLESVARTLFKSWFVDFEPVRKGMEGGEVGLRSDLAALFPNALVESDSGVVPEGWPWGSLSDVSQLNPESWSAESMPEAVVYVDLSSTKRGRIESVSSCFRDKAPSRARRVLRPGDTIVGTVRPGNESYALVSEVGLTGSTGFAVLRPKEPEYREIAYLAATAANNVETLALLADGGAYPAVSPQLVADTPLVLAPHDVVTAFSALTGPLLDRMARNERESRILARLLDALLPQLLTNGQAATGGPH